LPEPYSLRPLELYSYSPEQVVEDAIAEIETDRFVDADLLEPDSGIAAVELLVGLLEHGRQQQLLVALVGLAAVVGVGRVVVVRPFGVELASWEAFGVVARRDC